MRVLLAFTLLLVSMPAMAQHIRWSLFGSIQDEKGLPMASATITLLDRKDSTLVAFGVSDVKGDFEIKNIRKDEVLLQVSFVGYATLNQNIQRPENSLSLTLGKVTLKEKTEELSEFTVESIAPITIKKDTIEYHADAFKTLPNANVEELLKRLPGMEIDSDGNIRAQGERVRRVLVDGKEFFGNDPKLATKNLLAEAIDKVQILDRKSDQSQFTGIDDGQREKTINLKLKDSHKKGFFGNLTGGYGDQHRYKLNGSLNKFSDKQQLSFLGLSNNVNEQGFSIDDYINFQGGIQSFASGGGQVRVVIGGPGGGGSGVPINNGQRINGIMGSQAFGTNLNKDFNKRTQLRSSYFYNQLNHNITQDTDRRNFFPSGDFNFSEKSRQDNQSVNHRLNLIVDHKIDSLNSFRSTTNVQLTQLDNVSSSVTANRDQEGNLLNRGLRSNMVFGNSYQANSELLLRHRFGKPGKTISANLTFGLNSSDSEGSLIAENEFFGQRPSRENIEQLNFQNNRSFNYGINTAYTEPLGGRKYLELYYNFRQNHNDVNREVFDWLDDNLVFNQNLSNKFNSLYTYHRPGANFSYNSGKYNFVAGLAMQATQLRGELLLWDEQVNNNFRNLLPNMQLNYSFSNTKNLLFNYQTTVNEPSIEQLQPVIDNSDPLNIYIGNPELRPAYNHSWRVNYNSYDMGKFVNLFANAFLNFTENAIVNAQSIDERQIRTISPVNVRNNVLAGANVNFGFPIKQLKSRFNIGPNINYSQGFNQINALEDIIRIQNLGGNARYDFNWKEFVNFGLTANVSRQSTAYDFRQDQNQLFLNRSFGSDLGINFLKKYTVSGTFTYLSYTSKTTGFDESIPLLNLSFSRFVLKNNLGEIKLAGNNLLNQNIGVVQRADVNFIEQTVTNNLGRFVMLSFTYRLNNKLNPMGNMGRMGSGMRMMRMQN